MPALALLRSRDPAAALLAAVVLVMLLGMPAREAIRMKDAPRAITISLAAPAEDRPRGPEPPRPAQPSRPRPPEPVAPQRTPVPRLPEPAASVAAQPIAPAIATPPAPPAPPRQESAPPAPPSSVPDVPERPSAPNPQNIESAYVAKLRGYLESVKRYPTTREARSMRPQGRVRVWLEIDRAGALRDAGIGESSGSMILDGAALHTVRQGTYPAFPAQTWSGQPSHRFEVTLEYTLDG